MNSKLLLIMLSLPGGSHILNKDRLTARIDGDFVLFLIGMRINQPLMVHRWFPVFLSMPKMVNELKQQPEMGFIHAETWFSRTIMMVQYWRSIDQLLLYAKNPEASHLPAWRNFNRAVNTGGAVGIWHETYVVSSGNYENIYVNMPAFGLGRAGKLFPATEGRQSAAGRLKDGVISESANAPDATGQTPMP